MKTGGHYKCDTITFVYLFMLTLYKNPDLDRSRGYYKRGHL